MALGDVMGVMKFKETTTGQDLGWSESHAYQKSEDLNVVKNELKALAEKRVQLLGAGVILEEIFVSNVAIWRDSGVDFGLLPTKTDQGPIYNRDLISPYTRLTMVADFAYTALLTRLQSVGSPLYRRSLWLPGCPDEAQDIKHRDPRFNAVWTTAWNAYAAALAGATPDTQKWGFRVKDRTDAAVFESKVVKVDAATGVITVRNKNPAQPVDPGLEQGKQVVVRNLRGFNPTIAGVYLLTNRVDVGLTSQLTLRRVGTAGLGPPLVGKYLSGGYIRLLKWKAVAYAACTPIRFGNRRVAGPLAPLKARHKPRPEVIKGV